MEELALSKILVLLVEYNPICLEELKAYLEAEPDLSVVGATAKEEAIQVVKQHDVDVVLLNAMLTPPLLDGLDAAIEMLDIKPMKIIILTSVEETEVIVDAFTIGVLNYMNKAHYADIPAAIRDAHHNMASIHSDAAASLRKEFAELKRKELQRMITPTEKEILRLMGEGYTKRQAAQKLNIAVNTVRSHIQRMIKKMGGKTGKEVAEKARRGGLFDRRGK